ncbi:MAG: pyridoxal phosphate-dependent aminotransferase [Pseudonocardia sp.]|nr:pyridoxal phosphate-dependent aminotransferase [Pseudonocardia sp.]
MTSLVDSAVRFDLAESTSPPLRLDDLVDPAELAGLSLGYGTSRGDDELRSLVAAGCGVGADQVLVTVGAVEAMFLLAQQRCVPGERVLVVGPCFPPARAVPEGLGSPVDVVGLRFDHGYRLDLAAVTAALTPATRLVSLASPQNPSGVATSLDELRALVAAVEERAPDAVVLVDETYRESTYGDAPVPTSAAALSPRVVTCSSLSKAHGAPGLRIGWLTCTDPELYEQLRNAKFVTTIACSGPDEYLGTQVLRRRAEILAPRAAALAAALVELEKWADRQPVEIVRPDGGALCCLRLPSDLDIATFHARIAARDVRVAPGPWFGDDDRVFRLGFGHLPPADFTEALDRLGDALTG